MIGPGSPGCFSWHPQLQAHTNTIWGVCIIHSPISVYKSRQYHQRSALVWFRSSSRSHHSATVAGTKAVRISYSSGLGCLNAPTCRTPPTEADHVKGPERLVFERRNSLTPCCRFQIGPVGRVNVYMSLCQTPKVLTSYSFDGLEKEYFAVGLKGGRCDMSNQAIRR